MRKYYKEIGKMFGCFLAAVLLLTGCSNTPLLPYIENDNSSAQTVTSQETSGTSSEASNSSSEESEGVSESNADNSNGGSSSQSSSGGSSSRPTSKPNKPASSNDSSKGDNNSHGNSKPTNPPKPTKPTEPPATSKPTDPPKPTEPPIQTRTYNFKINKTGSLDVFVVTDNLGVTPKATVIGPDGKIYYPADSGYDETIYLFRFEVNVSKPGATYIAKVSGTKVGPVEAGYLGF